MKQTVCILILLIGHLATAAAQDRPVQWHIRGKVSTEEKQPIELANVALLLPDSTFVQGACSGSDGSFELVPPAPGSYLLQISSIGYQALCLPCKAGDTVSLILKADAILLKETVVTASRPVFKLEGGRLETNVRQTLLASLNSAGDVLKHIPGLRSSDEGYTVFGKGTPAIYIDNRLLQDLSELELLSAADIEKVELITNPGAEYEATVKSVVRIRTIQGKADSMGGSLRTGITQRHYTGYSEQISLNYQKNGLSLNGMLHAGYNHRRRSQEVRYQILSDAEWDVNSDVQLRNKGWSLGGKASAAYDISRSHSLGVSYDYLRTPDYQLRTVSNYTVRRNDVPDDHATHTSQDLQQSSKHQLNAYYQGSIKQLQIDFTADFLRSQNYNRQEAHEVSQTEGKRDISSFNRASGRLYAAKLLFTHPLAKGQLKAGADYSFIRRKDRFLNHPNILPNTESRIDESKAAGFAEYSLSLGEVSLLAGLRFEHTVSDYREQGEYVPGQSRTYNDWCPNLSIDFPTGQAQTNFSYTVKTNRPNFFQLRSALSYNNRFIYEGGNPQLIPETTHDLQLTTLYRWMQFGLDYQYRRNAIAFITKDYEENPDAVIFTTGNHKRMQYLTASTHLSPTIGPWKPELGLYFIQPFFKVINQGSIRHMNRASIYISCRNSLRLPGEWILSLDADYQSKGTFGAMLQHAYWGVDAGIRKTFFREKLTLSLQIGDLWNSRYGSFMLFGPRLTYTKEAIPDSRQLSLTVNYRFNAAGKAYKGGHVSDKDLQRL